MRIISNNCMRRLASMAASRAQSRVGSRMGSRSSPSSSSSSSSFPGRTLWAACTTWTGSCQRLWAASSPSQTLRRPSWASTIPTLQTRYMFYYISFLIKMYQFKLWTLFGGGYIHPIPPPPQVKVMEIFDVTQTDPSLLVSDSMGIQYSMDDQVSNLVIFLLIVDVLYLIPTRCCQMTAYRVCATLRVLPQSPQSLVGTLSRALGSPHHPGTSPPPPRFKWCLKNQNGLLLQAFASHPKSFPKYLESTIRNGNASLVFQTLYNTSELFKDCEFLQVLEIVHISRKVDFNVKMSVIDCVDLDIELKVHLLRENFHWQLLTSGSMLVHEVQKTHVSERKFLFFYLPQRYHWTDRN